MEYSIPYPSSVPHAILTPYTFNLDKMFFGCSLTLQCFFVGLSIVTFVFAFYFRCCGNHKLLIDQSNNQQIIKKDKQNIICEIVVKANFLDKDQESSSMSSQAKEQQPRNSLQSELLAHTLRIYERRFTYALTFTIPWVICINFFDANILVIIAGAVFIAFVILFNIRRMLPQWKITMLLYFVPALASIFAYVGGSHALYEWTPVLDPLQLKTT